MKGFALLALLVGVTASAVPALHNKRYLLCDPSDDSPCPSGCQCTSIPLLGAGVCIEVGPEFLMCILDPPATASITASSTTTDGLGATASVTVA